MSMTESWMCIHKNRTFPTILTVFFLLIYGCGGSGGSDPLNKRPAASFTVSSYAGESSVIMVFDGSGSTDSDGTISNYSWSFGDGYTGTGETTSYVYDRPQTYTVALTITDDDGATARMMKQVTVPEGVTVSGVVSSVRNMISDSDVNNPSAPYASNDSFLQAQEITVTDDTVSVSGFVNVNNTGASPDRFATSGDYEDYYRMALEQGQVITLYMVDLASSQLDLYLYDSGENLIDSATTNSNGLASLSVTADGTYYIRVVAVESGAIRTFTMYGLIFEQTKATGEDQLHLAGNFVPGDVLVRFEESSSQASSTQTLAAFSKQSKAVSALGFATKAGSSGRDRLLRPKASGDKDALFENLGVQAAFKRSVAAGYMDKTTKEKLETLWMIRGLRNQSGVRYAEPNYIRKAFAFPNDQYYSSQWNLPLINLEAAWDDTTGSSDIIVAVVDTGVLLSHPDLNDQLVAGYDFISDDEISGDDTSGIDTDPDDPGDSNVDADCSFHGTHVAGIMAAETNTTADLVTSPGVAGVAWSIKLMPLRALGIGGGTTYDVMQAVKYAAGLDNDSGTTPTNPADIINLSLGGEGSTTYEQEIYDEAREQGVIIIAAAGNESTDTPAYPAAYDGVVSVSAVDSAKAFAASYSNYGSTIDVAAPGGSATNRVTSTCGNRNGTTYTYTYEKMAGTSMAAPHVAGVAALMKSLYPALTPAQFDGLLAGGYLTQDLGTTGRDNYYGYGMIDAQKAVTVAKESAANGYIPAIIQSDPSSISFGRTLTTSDVTVSNLGGEALTVDSAVSDSSWLSVTATDTDSSGLGTYTLTVDRSGLSDDTYSGTITFSGSSRNEAVVTVTMRVGEYADTTDGGYHYILLVDAVSDEVVGQFESAGNSGIYEFNLTGDLENQSIFIYAGTDANNDGWICDEGEACGAYPSLNAPEAVTISQDMDGYDFTTDINIHLPGIFDTATLGSAPKSLPLKIKKETGQETKTDKGIRIKR